MKNLTNVLTVALLGAVLTGCSTLSQKNVEVDAEEYARLKQLAMADHYYGAQQQQAQQYQAQQAQLVTQQQYMDQQQSLNQQQIQMMHESKPMDPAYVETRESVLHQRCIDNISSLTADNRKAITIEGSVRAVSGCVGVAKSLR